MLRSAASCACTSLRVARLSSGAPFTSRSTSSSSSTLASPDSEFFRFVSPRLSSSSRWPETTRPPARLTRRSRCCGVTRRTRSSSLAPEGLEEAADGRAGAATAGAGVATGGDSGDEPGTAVSCAAEGSVPVAGGDAWTVAAPAAMPRPEGTCAPPQPGREAPRPAVTLPRRVPPRADPATLRRRSRSRRACRARSRAGRYRRRRGPSGLPARRRTDPPWRERSPRRPRSGQRAPRP